VLDISSFKKLKKYNLRLLKIPSTISEDKVFLNFVKENYKGEIVVSTGMTNEDYLLECAKLFKKK
jgi:sialic acid synthase SpsE